MPLFAVQRYDIEFENIRICADAIEKKYEGHGFRVMNVYEDAFSTHTIVLVIFNATAFHAPMAFFYVWRLRFDFAVAENRCVTGTGQERLRITVAHHNAFVATRLRI